jgi:hypothetical protein
VIDLSTATFIGSEAADIEILGRLPEDYRKFLLRVNGCVLFDGGLHIRGACERPYWHSLRRVWIGADALSNLFTSVERDDVPFAEDALGDQYLLRGLSVFRLSAETDVITPLNLTWPEFFKVASSDPVSFLGLQPLTRFNGEGARLAPGQLLNIYPPFCFRSDQERSLRAIPALEQIRFLADFASQVRKLPDGAEVRFIVK